MKTCSQCQRELPLASFHKNKRAKDGVVWSCKECKKADRHKSYERNKNEAKRKDKEYRTGQGSFGLRSRMTRLLGIARWNAVHHSWCPPNITAEKMVVLWDMQQGLCAACGEVMIKSCFDHSHETGVPRGFVHRHCNFTEGNLKKIGDSALVAFLRFYRPTVVALLEKNNE